MSRTGRDALIVVDLAFGDCGKGSIVDFLCRRRNVHTVVRFNGGPQAGHNVVTPEGRHHTFSQFGSGTFLPHVRTFLSRFMLIEPYALLNESAHLESIGVTQPMDRLLIDARCPVITPAHQAANRIRELARGTEAHGTCGMGIGELMQDRSENPELILLAHELNDRSVVIRKLRAVCDAKLEQFRDTIQLLGAQVGAAHSIDTLLNQDWINIAVDNYAHVANRVTIIDDKETSKLFHEDDSLIFEGAQGVLLDEQFGFTPHTTWSRTTSANAHELLEEHGFHGARTGIGVLRSYFTRHGQGPFVTEDDELRANLPENHNSSAGWQGTFRVGGFDAVAARYALAACGGADCLAVTHLDRIAALNGRVCATYRDRSGKPTDDLAAIPRAQLTDTVVGCRPLWKHLKRGDERAFLDFLHAEFGTPVAIESYGPTATDKRSEIC